MGLTSAICGFLVLEMTVILHYYSNISYYVEKRGAQMMILSNGPCGAGKSFSMGVSHPVGTSAHFRIY